ARLGAGGGPPGGPRPPGGLPPPPPPGPGRPPRPPPPLRAPRPPGPDPRPPPPGPPVLRRLPGAVPTVAPPHARPRRPPPGRHAVRRVGVLASGSRDGQLIAEFARRFGLDVVRGSSSRGGAGALRALVAAIRAGRDVALAPDGPRGPRRQLGSGVVALAALTGAPGVALGFAARPAWRVHTVGGVPIPSPVPRAARAV